MSEVQTWADIGGKLTPVTVVAVPRRNHERAGRMVWMAYIPGLDSDALNATAFGPSEAVARLDEIISRRRIER